MPPSHNRPAHTGPNAPPQPRSWVPLGRAYLLLITLALLFCTGARAADVAPLRLGIMPFNSALALIKTHQPLTRHLEKELGRPVAVFTAPDYGTYLKELLDGRFDLAIAGPHFAVMAREQGAVILFRYRADLQPVFVVRADSSLRSLDQLRGKRIGLSSPLSISSIGGMKWLHDHGLKSGQDYQLVERTTHGAAIAGVAVGDLDAALTTHTPLKQVPEDVRARIRELPLDIHVPHLMTLANPQLSARDVERIRTALRKLPETPEGREFFKETGYQGYEPVSNADIQALRPYIEVTQQVLKQGAK